MVLVTLLKGPGIKLPSASINSSPIIVLPKGNPSIVYGAHSVTKNSLSFIVTLTLLPFFEIEVLSTKKSSKIRSVSFPE